MEVKEKTKADVKNGSEDIDITMKNVIQFKEEIENNNDIKNSLKVEIINKNFKNDCEQNFKIKDIYIGKIKKKKNKPKRKKKRGLIRRFLSLEKIKFKNIYSRKFRTLARILKKIYNKKLKELQDKIDFVNQCKDFFEKATEATLQHKKEFMTRLEQYELDSMKLVEFFRAFERNKSDIENIAKRISKVEFKTVLDWNRKFKSKFDKLIG